MNRNRANTLRMLVPALIALATWSPRAIFAAPTTGIELAVEIRDELVFERLPELRRFFTHGCSGRLRVEGVGRSPWSK